MITFTYEDKYCTVNITSPASEAGALVRDLKKFMLCIGYHVDTVERVVLLESERQGLPRQLDLFEDDTFVEEIL